MLDNTIQSGSNGPFEIHCSGPLICHTKPSLTKGSYTCITRLVPACPRSKIDCLTGDHRVLRTDIVMDVGESINPAIDIGQVKLFVFATPFQLKAFGIYSLHQDTEYF